MKVSKINTDLIIKELGWKIGCCLFGDSTIFRIDKVEINDADRLKYNDLKITVYPDRWHENTIEYNVETGKGSGGYTYKYINVPYEILTDRTQEILNGTFDLTPYLEDNRQTTELMSFNKETYVNYRDQLEERSLILKALVQNVKLDVENKIQNLKNIVTEFGIKIRKLNTIIFTIELYLGIEEEIHQLKVGKTSDDTIRLLQSRLYMDEELGDPSDGGLEIKNLGDFDNWLLKENEYHKCFNYELLVPFYKCVRILRVRRFEKDRSYMNPFLASLLAAGDWETYILIRNGDNIYRIASKLGFGAKLFPDQTELADLYENTLDDLKGSISINGKDMRSREAKLDAASLTVKEHVEIYKRNLIMMQGLIDRTEVFGKLFGLVNFLDGSSAEKGDVEFFYEDESTRIEDGSESPIDWYYKCQNYEEGDEIIVMNTPSLSEYGRSDDRSYYYFKYRYDARYYPSLDWDRQETYKVYVEKAWGKIGDHEGHDVSYIKVYPHSSYYSRAKQRISLRIDDGFSCVNINKVSHRDLDTLWALLHDRRDRIHYLDVMSTLLKVRNYKLQQIEEEKPFVQLLMGQLNEPDEKLAMDYVQWWKTKNKWKRSLNVDDQKALRMIIKKYKN